MRVSHPCYTTRDSILCFESAMSARIIPRIKVDAQPKLLAKHIWSSGIDLAFDVSNDSYDPASFHLPARNNLDVSIARVGKIRLTLWPAPSPVRAKVKKIIPDAHSLNGWNDERIFLEDHTLEKTPMYTWSNDKLMLR